MESKRTVFLAAVLTLAAPSALATSEYIGVIKRSSGHVLVEREGVKLASSAGMELKQGDRLLTGPDGYAQIKLRGAAPVSVSPDADISLDRFVYGQSSVERTPPGLLARLASFFALNRQRH